MVSMLRGMLGWRARLGRVSGVLVAIAVSLGQGISPAAAQREPPPSQAAMQYSFAPDRAQGCAGGGQCLCRIDVAGGAVAAVCGPLLSRVLRPPVRTLPGAAAEFARLGRDRQRERLDRDEHARRQKFREAEVRVVLADRREFKADIVQQDEKTDIALIKIRGAGAKFPFIRFADFKMRWRLVIWCWRSATRSVSGRR